MNFVANNRGSALLVALLLMGFLSVFGVGMSRLIVSSIRVEHNVVEAGKSYFAAEAGIEQRLYTHEHRLPGYQKELDLTLENGAEVSVATVASETQIPCGHREEWRELDVQESVSWPLFRWDDSVGRVDVENFKLSYEFDRQDLVVEDVLRWKILGLTRDGNTEAISGVKGYSSLDNFLQESDTANFYGQSGATYSNYPVYPIKDFLTHHQLNYLTLTNITDFNGAQALEKNVLKVKMDVPESSACEYTQIRAVGESGGARQSIDAQVKLDSFLPVFDFVLYQVEPQEES